MHCILIFNWIPVRLYHHFTSMAHRLTIWSKKRGLNRFPNFPQAFLQCRYRLWSFFHQFKLNPTKENLDGIEIRALGRPRYSNRNFITQKFLNLFRCVFGVIIHDQPPLFLMKDFCLGEKMCFQYVNKQIRIHILRKIHNGNVPMEENAAQT